MSEILNQAHNCLCFINVDYLLIWSHKAFYGRPWPLLSLCNMPKETNIKGLCKSYHQSYPQQFSRQCNNCRLCRQKMTTLSLIKVSLLWVVVMMVGHSTIASDDNGPLEAVVQQLTQKVEQLDARMEQFEARTEARMTGYETELREC